MLFIVLFYYIDSKDREVKISSFLLKSNFNSKLGSKSLEKKEPKQKIIKNKPNQTQKKPNKKPQKTTEKNPYALLFYKLSYENSWQYSCISNKNL